MPESTSPTNPVVPDWAERAMSVLPTLILETGVERDLIDAVFILLRDRFGLSALGQGACAVARGTIEDALSKLDKQGAQS